MAQGSVSLSFAHFFCARRTIPGEEAAAAKEEAAAAVAPAEGTLTPTKSGEEDETAHVLDLRKSSSMTEDAAHDTPVPSLVRSMSDALAVPSLTLSSSSAGTTASTKADRLVAAAMGGQAETPVAGNLAPSAASHEEEAAATYVPDLARSSSSAASGVSTKIRKLMAERVSAMDEVRTLL